MSTLVPSMVHRCTATASLKRTINSTAPRRRTIYATTDRSFKPITQVGNMSAFDGGGIRRLFDYNAGGNHLVHRGNQPLFKA